MTLTYIDLEQAQSTWHIQVWLIGVAEQKAQFNAFMGLIKHFEVKPGQFFNIFDIMIALATH